MVKIEGRHYTLSRERCLGVPRIVRHYIGFSLDIDGLKVSVQDISTQKHLSMTRKDYAQMQLVISYK